MWSRNLKNVNVKIDNTKVKYKDEQIHGTHYMYVKRSGLKHCRENVFGLTLCGQVGNI